MIDAHQPLPIAWPVQPGREGENTRPAALVRELEILGVDCARRTCHGWKGVDGVRRAGRRHDPAASESGVPWIRRAPFGDAGYGSFTPLLAEPGADRLRWFDGYDDWSIAPDVPRPLRVLAARSYRQVPGGPAVLTANSSYMVGRLGRGAQLIPNGADATLADASLGGDDALRVVILGSLHRGRVDDRAVRSALRALPDEEFVFGGAGTAPYAEAAQRSGQRTVARRFLPMGELGRARVGGRTVAVLPLQVCDYTLSQDPMKLYDYLTLGLPIVMPRLLWPRHLPVGRAALYETGDDIGELVRSAAHCGLEARSGAAAFVAQHSWAARARSLHALLFGADSLPLAEPAGSDVR